MRMKPSKNSILERFLVILHSSEMAKNIGIETGATVTLTGTVSHAWQDGKITVRLKGYDHPITINEKSVEAFESPAKTRPAKRNANELRE